MEWSQSGYYTCEESENLRTFTVAREGVSNIVTWENEEHVAVCSCLCPSSRHFPCRHVIRVAVEKKRPIDGQIGHRWRQEVSYTEDSTYRDIRDESVSEGNFNPLPYPNFKRATFPTLTWHRKQLHLQTNTMIICRIRVMQVRVIRAEYLVWLTLPRCKSERSL